MKKFYSSLSEDNRLLQCSSTRSSESDLEFVVQDDHEALLNPIAFKYENGRLIKDTNFILDRQKEKKLEEFNDKCNKTILGYFKSTVVGVEYEFSNDMEAQSRFNGVAGSFSLGLIDKVQWTAHKDGERYRLTLTKEQFLQVAKDAFVHQDSNIVKYNNLIQAVKSARSKEELDKIVW